MNLVVALTFAAITFLIFRRRSFYEQELAVRASAHILIAECEAVLRAAALR